MQSNSAHKILIVDDEEFTREILVITLTAEGYVCRSSENAEEAQKFLAEEEFSLMVSDISMPGISGLELLRISREKHEDMAVIMVTAVDDRKVAIQTLNLGAYGYLIKPFDRNEIVISVANALSFRKVQAENKKHKEELEYMVEIRTRELKKAEQQIALSREETINRLAKAAEFRDDETARHTVRMSHYCWLLAEKFGLSNERCEMIRVASPLHDVGKIGVPDNILLKPGKLTFEEFETIKNHPEIGQRILKGSNSKVLQLATSIAWTHHEKYDGTGYPRGLTGDTIPIEGRIASVCDVFDALTSDRVYKSAMPPEEALVVMRDEMGDDFDPELFDLFRESLDEVLTIKSEFADRTE